MSDDYTPTTGEVGLGYCLSRSAASQVFAAEFDRWLAAERARVWDEGVAAMAEEVSSVDDVPPYLYLANPYKETT